MLVDLDYFGMTDFTEATAWRDNRKKFISYPFFTFETVSTSFVYTTT